MLGIAVLNEKKPRHWCARGKPINEEILKVLWYSNFSGSEISARMGHHNSVLRRKAAAMGLPLRRFIWDKKRKQEMK